MPNIKNIQPTSADNKDYEPLFLRIDDAVFAKIDDEFFKQFEAIATAAIKEAWAESLELLPSLVADAVQTILAQDDLLHSTKETTPHH